MTFYGVDCAVIANREDVFQLKESFSSPSADVWTAVTPSRLWLLSLLFIPPCPQFTRIQNTPDFADKSLR